METKGLFTRADQAVTVRTFEPVRLCDVEGVGGTIEIGNTLEDGDQRLRDVVVRPYNFSLETPLEVEKEDCVILSIVAVKSHPSTPSSPPSCEMIFRVWTDVPSSAFLLQSILEQAKDSLVVTHYPPCTIHGDDVQPCRRIRVLFDEVELAPLDLDMRENTQAFERVILKNARYVLVEDQTSAGSSSEIAVKS